MACNSILAEHRSANLSRRALLRSAIAAPAIPGVSPSGQSAWTTAVEEYFAAKEAWRRHREKVYVPACAALDAELTPDLSPVQRSRLLRKHGISALEDYGDDLNDEVHSRALSLLRLPAPDLEGLLLKLAVGRAELFGHEPHLAASYNQILVDAQRLIR